MSGEHKGGEHATSASLPAAMPIAAEPPTGRGHPGRPRRHRAMPGEDQPQERARYVAGAFRDEAEMRAASRKRRSNPDHVTAPDLPKRPRYSVTQLDAERIAAIEVDYRACIKPVEQICEDHSIVKSTLYKLAELRSWPLRSEIQRAMAEAVSQRLVDLTTSELRRQQHGDSGEDRPVDPLAALADDAVDRFEAETGQELLRGIDRAEDGEDLTQRSLDDIASGDILIERYALATAIVLKQHRRSAQAAVAACSDLVGLLQQSIERAKAAAAELIGDPTALAKHLEPVAKVLASSVGTMQKAIEMQRQAFALDEKAGKGLPLDDLTRHRAAAAGFARPGQQQEAEAGAGAPENERGAGEAIPLPSDAGGYDALVRAAEARGLRLA